MTGGWDESGDEAWTRRVDDLDALEGVDPEVGMLLCWARKGVCEGSVDMDRDYRRLLDAARGVLARLRK